LRRERPGGRATGPHVATIGRALAGAAVALAGGVCDRR
jgi:hypothetical protein